MSAPPSGGAVAHSKVMPRAASGTTAAPSGPIHDRPAVPDYPAAAFRAGQQFGPVAAVEQHQIGRAADRDPAVALGADDLRRPAGDRRRPVADRAIELEDPHRLAQHLEPVQIAIAVERVAGVVRRHGHRDTACPHLLQQRDPRASAGCGRPGGPAGTCCTGAARRWRCRPLRPGPGCGRHRPSWLVGQGAAMAADDTAGEAVAHRRLGDVAQGSGLRVGRLVAMEIEVQPVSGGEAEHDVECRVQLRALMKTKAPRDTAMFGDQRRQIRPEAGQEILHRTGSRRPASRSGRPIPPASRRRRARRSSAAVRRNPDGSEARTCHGRRRSAGRNPCAGAHPPRDTAWCAVLGPGRQRAVEAAVRVRPARPDVALVDMGVHVDEAGQTDAAAGRWRPARSVTTGASMAAMRPPSTRRSSATRPSLVRRSGRPQIVRPAVPPAPWRWRSGTSRQAAQAGRRPSQFSRFNALSCHLRNSRCESRLRTRKIRMPVMEISSRAANMRGTLSR